MKTIKQHLIERRLNPDEHYCYISEADRCATFLLWNLSGQLVGYQRYNPDKDKKKANEEEESRYYSFVGDETTVSNDAPKRGKKRIAIWGVHTLSLSRIVFLSEGIFNAVIPYNLGFSSLGLLTSNPVHVKNFLTMLNRPKIAVCDGDVAGVKLMKFADYGVVLSKGQDLSSLDPAVAKEVILQSVQTLEDDECRLSIRK